VSVNPVGETEESRVAFTNETILRAWQRSGGKCECERISHNHNFRRCNKTLIWGNRGKDWMIGSWEAHHKTAVSVGGSNTLSNCEILCIDCHKTTRSYGG